MIYWFYYETNNEFKILILCIFLFILFKIFFYIRKKIKLEGFAKFKGEIKSFSLKAFIFLIVINIFAFSVPIFQHSYKKPYAKAKAFATAAATINIIYIVPLSNLFGYKNILTSPFYPIRDYLYNKSISLYPIDEGEREMMWFRVRYYEYDKLIHPLVQDIGGAPGPSDGKEQILLVWQDELLNHLKPFSSLKVSDPELRKLRFNQFINYALSAYWNREFVVGTILYTDINAKYADPILRNSEELKKLESVLYYYEKMKKYAEKYEPEGLDYFYHQTMNEYIEEVLKYEIAQLMITSQMVNKKLDCNGKYVKMYGNSFAKLYEMANNSSWIYNRLYHLGILSGWHTEDIPLLKKCTGKDLYLKEIKKYIELKTRKKLEEIDDYSSKPIEKWHVIRNGKKFYY